MSYMPQPSSPAFGAAGRVIGIKRRLDLYAPTLPSGYFFDWMAKSGLSEAVWLKGSGPSQATLWKDDAMFENLQPRLKGLSQDTLLIKGHFDANTAEDQLASFRANVSRGHVASFAHSGHLAHAEEPERYAEAVSGFVLSGRA